MSQIPAYRVEIMPWRLPFLGDTDLFFENGRGLVITPVVKWASVIEPLDLVELVDAGNFERIAMGFVAWVKKMPALFMEPHMFKYWRRDVNDIESMLTVLKHWYPNSLDTRSTILKIGVCVDFKHELTDIRLRQCAERLW